MSLNSECADKTIADPNLVAVFMRQSTKKKSQEKSIPRQRMGLREWSETIGWAFPTHRDCFYEKKISGTLLNPELDRLMRDLASGRRRAVMIDDLSRATRLALKTFQLWDLIKKVGALLAIRSRCLVIDPRRDQQDMLIFFEGLLNEAYWEMLGRMSADGSRLRARNGLWCGGPVPPGFARKGKGVLVPDKVNGRGLELQLMAAGSMSLRQASRYLKARLGLDVSPSTLHHRAHNRIYEGMLVYGKTKKGYYRKPRAVMGDVVLRKSQKAGIAPVEVERAIQSPVATGLAIAPRSRLRASKNNGDGMGLRSSGTPPFALSGITFCAVCGDRFTRRLGPANGKEAAPGRYKYVGCWTDGCANRSRRQELVEDAAWTALRALAGNAPAVSEALRRALGILRKDNSVKAKKLADQVRELEAACLRLEEKVATSPTEDAEAFSKALAQIRERLVEERRELAVAGAAAELSLTDDDEASFLGWCADVVSRWKELDPMERLIGLRVGLSRAVVDVEGGVTLQPRVPVPKEK